MAASCTMTIGEEIREARKALGLTQPELAQQLGVSPSYVTKLEKDQALPSPERLLALADAIHLDRDHLLSLLEQTKQLRVQHGIRTRAATARRLSAGMAEGPAGDFTSRSVPTSGPAQQVAAL